MIKISRIVNVLNEVTPWHKYKVVAPFVVLFDVEGYEFELIQRWQHPGFASEYIAREYAENFLNTFKLPEAVLVLKNADFTEGRGPMIFHKMFRSVATAEEYIAKQSGIYGSGQYRSLRFGINVHGEGFVSVSRNGYDLNLVSFEDSI